MNLTNELSTTGTPSYHYEYPTEYQPDHPSYYPSEYPAYTSSPVYTNETSTTGTPSYHYEYPTEYQPEYPSYYPSEYPSNNEPSTTGTPYHYAITRDMFRQYVTSKFPTHERLEKCIEEAWTQVRLKLLLIKMLTYYFRLYKRKLLI